MKKPPLIALTALSLTLSACSGSNDTPDVVASEAVMSTPLTTEAPETDSAVEPAVVDEGTIPASLRGRWGLVPADCTSTRGDAKGLLTVGADRLTFYESVATLRTVSDRRDDGVKASFAFSGEGQSWDLDVTLTSPDGGKTLVRKDTGPDGAPGPLTYTKCR